MATLKERPNTYSARGIEVRDFRHDHGDGYDETPHRKTKKSTSKKNVGCSGNNDGPHVYVWTKEVYGSSWNYYYYYATWNWFVRFNNYEYKICAGCYKHQTTRRRKGVR